VAIDVVGDVDAFFGLDPLLCGGEASIGADDGDDAVSSGRDVRGAFEDEIEDGAKISAALFEEAGGAGMAIDGRPVERRVDAQFAFDVARRVPVDEKLFDGFAFRVIADPAFAAVKLEGGFPGGFDFAFRYFRSAKSGFCAGGGDGFAFSRR